ncbi:3'(2'),5'-bisphosphate nucleotidase CysQ [Alphaproteobacteria bacterium]|nr:3'(2'),5'-bisphosphate nucleotidase CysQ [Alphaproteobacteria bacterium]
MHDYNHLIGSLIPAVRAAGAAIMDIHRGGVSAVSASIKSDGSPVTAADEAAEKILVHALGEVAPEVPVISEENPDSHKLAAPPLFFLVDPLDGTKEFLRADGEGAFTVNIGLIDAGVPVMGIVYAPALDRLFVGAKGVGASELNTDGDKAITIVPVPSDGARAVASRSHIDDVTKDWLASYGIEQVVRSGSSLKFCLVAAGEADVYPRFGPTMEWDTAAGDAVLRAAGGAVYQPDGALYVYGKPDYKSGHFIACGGFSI